MSTLGKMIGATFKATAPRRADPHRKHREQARALADQHEGDHFAHDWDDVLTMVRDYVPN